MKSTSQKISFIEKVGYSLGDLAANLVFQTLITYLAYFYTDIYGLNNTDASIIMLTVGLIAAFVFNPIIGVLADRTNSKWGKFRPWILYTSYSVGSGSVFGILNSAFRIQRQINLRCRYLYFVVIVICR